MTVLVRDPDLTIHVGDVLDVLATLDDGSVDCCVTSPPYWGLRDYGTGSWDGGDPDCDHLGPPMRTKASINANWDKSQSNPYGFRGSGPNGPNPTYVHQSGPVDNSSPDKKNKEAREPMGRECSKCGASRVDRQLGLEASPQEYVAAMVAVFREVRRVLADHGTCWVNLGSSYMANASGGLDGSTLTKGGKQTASSRAGRAALRDAASRDTPYTEPQGSPAPGSACLDLCGECADDLTSRNPRTRRPRRVSASHGAQTDRNSGTPDPPETDQTRAGAPASTKPESSPPPPVLCWRCGTRPASVSLRATPTSSPDAPASEGTAESTNGTAPHGSESRSQDTDASGTAWVNYNRRLKPKDMVPIPWMVAMALQEDGWFLRADIIWAKPNPMPESVTDRPTKAHEYVFLLSKQPRYWFDQEAVRERYVNPDRPDLLDAPNGSEGVMGSLNGGRRARGPDGRKVTAVVGKDGSEQHRNGERWPNPTGRNVRSVWQIATQPYPEAHFATFPEELPRRCILAGCPEWVCGTCGKPRERIVEREFVKLANRLPTRKAVQDGADMADVNSHNAMGFNRTETVGWSDCGHNDWRPGVVLDPFFGAGTTGLVARNHGRRCVGIELNPVYAEMAANRLSQLSLLA